MRKSFSRRKLPPSLRRYLIFLVMIPLGYLIHVCIMPYVNIFGITPNLLYAVIAIVTVAYGRLQAFWVGLIYGLLMEIMLQSVPYLNLGLYALTSLFCAFVFADRSIRQLEMDSAMNRKSHGLPPLVRTVLCAMANVTVYEAINIIYISLGGSAVTSAHILRGVLDVMLTGLLTLAVAVPVRRVIFGKQEEKKVLRIAPIVFGRK